MDHQIVSPTGNRNRFGEPDNNDNNPGLVTRVVKYNDVAEPTESKPGPSYDNIVDKNKDIRSSFGSSAQSDEITSSPNQIDKPVAVVKTYSVRGVEYGMMTFMLWAIAISLAWCLVSVIESKASFDSLAIPVSALVVCMPIFTILFLRLKRAELTNPSLRLDASKRRFSQITQFVTFLVCVINLSVLVYLIINSFGSTTRTSWGRTIGDLVVILVIAGGILTYYWFDEHRQVSE